MTNKEFKNIYLNKTFKTTHKDPEIKLYLDKKCHSQIKLRFEGIFILLNCEKVNLAQVYTIIFNDKIVYLPKFLMFTWDDPQFDAIFKIASMIES